jgi:hypothetical protein
MSHTVFFDGSNSICPQFFISHLPNTELFYSLKGTLTRDFRPLFFSANMFFMKGNIYRLNIHSCLMKKNQRSKISCQGPFKISVLVWKWVVIRHNIQYTKRLACQPLSPKDARGGQRFHQMLMIAYIWVCIKTYTNSIVGKYVRGGQRFHQMLIIWVSIKT